MKRAFIPALTMSIGILLLFAPASSPQTESGEPKGLSLLGGGRGIDHLVILVRDLDAAENTFRTLLGFKVKRQGKFPEGFENSSIAFKDRGYLELVGIYDQAKAAQTEVAEFLRRHEGADGMGLHVSSARQTASFLQSRGFQVEGPASMDYIPEGEKEPQQFWLTVSFKEPVVPGGTFFFIEYNEKAIEEVRKKNPKAADNAEHANTAQKIKSVWVAVKDLQAAVKAYEALGFTAGRQVDFPQLGATGREIAAGGGAILLLQAHGSDSRVASFLTSRGEGIMGVSIQVDRLEAARGILETGVKRRFIPYSGAYGKSLLVPLELTRGLWFEMFTTDEPEIATIPGSNPAQRVTELADAYMKAWFEAFPENATYYAPPGARHDRLADNSLAAVQAWEKIEDDLAARLAEVREESLWGTPEWVTYGFLREALEASRGLRVCRNELWPANQMNGWQVSATWLLPMQPVGTADLRAQALARWRGLARYVDTEIANLKEGLRLGYSTPKRNVDLVLEQLDGILATPVAESSFFNPATRNDDPAFRKAWEELVRDEIYPAVRRYRDYLKSEYLPAAREPQTVAANPDGARCYAASLRAYTGLDRSPREVFESGQRIIEQREAKMKELGRKPFGTDDLAEIRKLLRDDRKNRFKSRDELLAFSKAAVQRARQALPGWFGRLPKADVVIEPQPEFQEKSNYSRYLPASEDGSRPGTYQINLYKPEEQTRAWAERVAFHEAWPGHHLQTALAQERSQAHPITRYLFNSGFAEGWARYTETTLADEMGLYSSDFNRLSMYAGVPNAMVADPGLHALGWTRQQVIDYILAKSPGSTPERAATDVDRIAITPGQVTTYGVGEQEIVTLREEARQALGPKLDLREFHDRVLENGSLTLGMLRQVIERWIAEKKRGSTAPP